MVAGSAVLSAGGKLFFAAVLGAPVAVPIPLQAMVDGAGAGRTAGNGVRHRAGLGVTAAAVVWVVAHVDLATIERVAITVGVSVEAAGERAAPGGAAARNGVLDHARSARFARAAPTGEVLRHAAHATIGSGTRLGAFLALAIVELIDVHGQRTGSAHRAQAEASNPPPVADAVQNRLPAPSRIPGLRPLAIPTPTRQPAVGSGTDTSGRVQ